MSIELETTTPKLSTRNSRSVVARLSARRAVRSGVIWGFVFGASIASSALSYAQIYKTPGERSALAAAYGTNTAMSALFGPAPRLQTVAGFTVFKISMTLMLLGAVWGLLTSTRLLRGEEDQGRWDLLLAGQTTRRGATGQALGGLGAGVVVLWAITAGLTVLIGRDSAVHFTLGASLYFSIAMVATAAMFLAVGAVASQVATSRRQSASLAGVFLAVSYAIRMVADAGVGLHTLIWASPLGWVEELQPFSAPRPFALAPIVAFIAVASAGALYLGDHRDSGAGSLSMRSRTRPHYRLLGGCAGLAVRTERAPIIGWWVAIGTSGLLYGLIAKSAGATISGSSVQQLFTKLGDSGTGASAVLGLGFLIIAIMIGFAAAGQITAMRSEESSGRLDTLLTRRVSRSSWLGARCALAVVAVIVSGVLGGVLGWLGAASQHSRVGAAAMLGAGLNVIPPAITLLGAGVLALGVWPRQATRFTYALLSWSVLVVVVGGFGTMSHWLLDTSVFHQMASSPAVSPRWGANLVMVAVGLSCALLGVIAFRVRDLRSQ